MNLKLLPIRPLPPEVNDHDVPFRLVSEKLLTSEGSDLIVSKVTL